MEGIKPCPFCGCEAEANNSYGGIIAYVRCTGCGIYSGNYKEKADAIAAWNTRAERTCHSNDDGGGDGAWLVCSECGEITHTEWFCVGYKIGNYCPGCGAKVVG